MKPHDKRRLNAFIKDEKEAAEEYNEMGREMEANGFIREADLFYSMAEDEAGHAKTVEHMIEISP